MQQTDAVAFRPSMARLCAVLGTAGVLTCAGTTLINWIIGGIRDPEEVIGSAVGMIAVLVIYLWVVYRLARLDVSTVGVAWTMRGGQPVNLTWAQITSARVRKDGPFAQLEIVPAELSKLAAHTPARDFPRIKDTPMGRAFVIDVGTLHPGPTTLRAEIDRLRPG